MDPAKINLTEDELQENMKKASSILKDMNREEFFIFKRGSVNSETGEIEGSSSFFSLSEVLKEYYSLKRKYRRQYGIWDVAREYPLDIQLAKETGMRAPDCIIDPDSGELKGYRM